MVQLIDSVEKLQDWQEYRTFLKMRLKLLEGSGPIFVSKKKQDFSIDGKPFRGHAVLAGPKADQSVKKLIKAGILFEQGTVTRQSKNLLVDGLEKKFMKEAAKVFLKLKLGYKLLGPGGEDDLEAEGEEPQVASEGGMEEEEEVQASQTAPSGEAAQGDTRQLAQRAQKIQKAVQVWNKTEEIATNQLRKLQRAVLALNDPRSKPVIKGLESILTRLDKVDDEAEEAAQAAARGDQQGFEVARQDFVNKVDRILAYVQRDELIADADANPAVDIKIKDTLTKSLEQLKKVV